MPFELGRPFGNPNDPEFQSVVLMEALNLLSEKKGPVLKNFTKEARSIQNEKLSLSCPVNFTVYRRTETEKDVLFDDFRQEFLQMRNWYELSMKRHQRSTVTRKFLNIEELFQRIKSFVEDGIRIQEKSNISPYMEIKLDIEDLKTYYFESICYQLDINNSSGQLANWFWGQTVAATIINEIKKKCKNSEDRELRRLSGFLIPRSQIHRFDE